MKDTGRNKGRPCRLHADNTISALTNHEIEKLLMRKWFFGNDFPIIQFFHSWDINREIVSHRRPVKAYFKMIILVMAV